MKRICIVLCIFIFAVSGVFAGESTSSESQASEQRDVSLSSPFAQKKLWLSGYFNIGSLKVSEPGGERYTTDLGFVFGIHFGGCYYLNPNFGLNLSIGFERVSRTKDTGITWSNIVPVNAGITLFLTSFFLNAGITIGNNIGIYLNPGYRIRAGNFAIPIGLELKYYFTSIHSAENDAKWWQLSLKVGFEF